jgi:hypothetical protein
MTHATVFDAFRATARKHPGNAWLCVPPKADRDYAPDGAEISYGEAFARIEPCRRAIARRATGPAIAWR